MNQPWREVQGGGVVIPWGDMPIVDGTTWMVRAGVFPRTEVLVIEYCLDIDINEHVPWAQEHWWPLEGKSMNPNGPATRGSLINGGSSATYRGTIDTGAALRVRIVEGTGFEIPVHVQLGSTSYVGVISTNQSNMIIIEEEMTIEDLLKS